MVGGSPPIFLLVLLLGLLVWVAVARIAGGVPDSHRRLLGVLGPPVAVPDPPLPKMAGNGVPRRVSRPAP